MKALGKHNIYLKRLKLHDKALRLLLALCMVVTLVPLVSSTPVQAANDLRALMEERAQKVSAAWTATVTILSDGTVWQWGNNYKEGDSDSDTWDIPVRIESDWGNQAIVSVAAGESAAIALAADGTVWSWGQNTDGLLGDGSNEKTTRQIPAKVNAKWGNRTIIAIVAGDSHFMALASDNTLWSWGRNIDGKLGDGTTTNRYVPVQVKAEWGKRTIVAIAAGSFHSMVLDSEGTIWSWGDNEFGQLGILNIDSTRIPMQTGDFSWKKDTKITKIASDYYHSLALDENGKLWSWGRNTDGQLGRPDSGYSYYPELIEKTWGNREITSLSVGINYSYVMASDGTVWNWGDNNYGQLGDDTGKSRYTSQLLIHPDPNIGDTFSLIDCGGSHMVAVKSDGSLWTWGNSNGGRLGIGSGVANQYSPVQVNDLTVNVPALTGNSPSSNYGDFYVTVNRGTVTYNNQTGVLKLHEGGSYLVNQYAVNSTEEFIAVAKTGKTTDTAVTLENIWIDNTNRDSAFKLPPDSNKEVQIILRGENKLISSVGAGIEKINSNFGLLRISGTGSLYAEGGENCAGIGGISNEATRNISIGSGTITAKGSNYGAGIGGGNGGDGIDISISGGTIIANGGYSGAGIGGGNGGNGVDIAISSGTVTAKGGYSGAGIGGGNGGNGVNIAISSGTVIANGGHSGAGIGGGYSTSSTSSNNIIISGGTITARGGSADKTIAADIGNAADSLSKSNITIDGGSVNAINISDRPQNSEKKPVYKMTIVLADNLTDPPKQDLGISSITGTEYGTNGIWTDNDGLLYLWLPEETVITEILDVIRDLYVPLFSPVAVKANDNNSNSFIKFKKTSFPIRTEVIGGEGQLVVFRSGGSPQGEYDSEKKEWIKPYADSFTEGNAGTNYEVMACIPNGYTLKSITLNNIPLKNPGSLRYGPDFMYGGDTYDFEMPEGEAVIIATLEEKTTGTQLATPTNIKWDTNTGKASWDKVANAEYYLVQLYKDGEKMPSETFKEPRFYFNRFITSYGYGAYTFSVKAIGDGNSYRNSILSKQSETISYTKGFEVTGTEGGFTYNKLNKMLTISQPGDYTVSLEEGVKKTDHRIDITAKEGTVNLTLDNVNIEAEKQSIWFSNDSPVDAVITLKGVNQLVSTNSTAIQKSGTSAELCGTLTIRDHKDGGGLYVEGKEHGIGGKKDINYESGLYHVNIESGNLTAVGGLHAIGSYYTSAHKDTAGNVDVNITPENNKVAYLYLGEDEQSQTLATDPFNSPAPYTSSAKFSRIQTYPVNISVNITWGSMEFTYEEANEGTWDSLAHEYQNPSAGGWKCDHTDGNMITVKNNGNLDVSVTPTYETDPGYSKLSGTFSDGTEPVKTSIPLPVNQEKKVWLDLTGKPNDVWSDKLRIGTVKITIGGGNQ